MRIQQERGLRKCIQTQLIQVKLDSLSRKPVPKFVLFRKCTPAHSVVLAKHLEMVMIPSFLSLLKFSPSTSYANSSSKTQFLPLVSMSVGITTSSGRLPPSLGDDCSGPLSSFPGPFGPLSMP